MQHEGISEQMNFLQINFWIGDVAGHTHEHFD
jgi:hypothetical protein